MKKHNLILILGSIFTIGCNTIPPFDPSIKASPSNKVSAPPVTSIITPQKQETTIPGVDPANAIKYQNQIKAIIKMQPESTSGYPETEDGIKKMKEKFKLTDYLSVLTNLSVEENWKLDYYYNKDGLGGYPVGFAYTGNDIPDDPSKRDPYLNHIKIDGTEDGFMQYTILSILGEKFLLFWHSNYNDTEIICTYEELNQLLSRKDSSFYNFDDKFVEDAKTISPAPSVTFEDNQVIVRIIVFSKWGGLSERKYYIAKQFPHKIIKYDDTKVLAKYDVGLRF